MNIVYPVAIETARFVEVDPHMRQRQILEGDLKSIEALVGGDWAALDGARIFITGGTGFIGTWLLEALRHAERAGRKFEVLILSRNPERFRQLKPWLADWSRLAVVQGDIKDFAFPEGQFDYVIHAATDASAALNRDHPLTMFETVVQGTRRVLDFSALRKVRRLLFLSSGAVYGAQPWHLTHVPETWSGGPDITNPTNSYGEAKRAAELLCAIYARQCDLAVVTARIFAVIGPHLPLNAHFAAGNFIGNAIRGEEIIVEGDGRPCRSYLYVADLTTALLRMLARGPKGEVYNVGSEQTVSIAELAQAVARVTGGSYRILGKAQAGWNPGRYAPAMTKFNLEFGGVETVALDEAISRTARWNGWTQ